MDYNNSTLTPIQKLRVAIVGMLLILILGMSGFMSLEEMSLLDALYMTVITLSTVGFSEIAPLHPAGRIFVIFLIVFGVVLAGFIASVIGQLVLEGQFKELYGRRKMESKIRKLSNHFIIAGFGRVGRHVAIELTREKVPFIVIDKDEKTIGDLLDENILFVEGDSTDEDVLVKAGIETAKTLISTLPDEAQNVYLTLTARDMNKNLNIIARADYDGGEKKLLRAGANHVVIPHQLGGLRMAMASLRPNVVDFMHVTALGEGGLTIEEVKIPADCRLAGKTLIESNLKQDYNVTLIGIKQPNKNIIIAPQPNTILGVADILVLIGPTDDLVRLTDDLS